MGRQVVDWGLVSREINKRMAELDLSQQEVASRARVSQATVRELQWHTVERRRSCHTLAALSEALGWPPNHLESLRYGEHEVSAGGSHPSHVNVLEDRVNSLAARVAALEASRAR